MPDVDRLPSGRWQARWRDDAGKQRKRSFRLKSQAVAWISEVESSKSRGTYVDHRAGRIMLSEYASEWVATRPLRASTARRVASTIKVHITGTELGSLPLASIRPTHVQAWATARSKILAPSTTRLTLKLLRSILLSAVEDRLIASTPARRVVIPSVEAAPVVALSVDEVMRLAEAVPSRCRAMVITQAGLGLRLGELLALRVQDVNFLGRIVKIHSQIRQHDRERVDTKTNRSRRSVPLPKVVADALARHIELEPQGEDGTIFVTGTGRPWRQDYYSRTVMKRAVAKSGIPSGTTSHDLRHHFVSVQLDAGASVAEVAHLIGDTTTTVVAVYAHMLPGCEQRARDRIDSAWSAPTVPGEVGTGS